MRVAANVAFAAIHAGGLQRPVTVSLLDPDGGGIVEIIAEEDVDVAELRIPPFLLGDFLEQLRAHDLRSEEHTSELQSRLHLVCRLLLEKKKRNKGETGYRKAATL